MSGYIVNPYEVTQDYNDVRNDLGSWRDSDIAKQLSADAVLMNAQYQMDDAWYNAHESAVAQMDEFKNIGVNPLSAARAIMGTGVNGSGNNVAGTVNGSGRSAVLDQFLSGLNVMNDATSNLTNSVRTQAEIENLDSQTRVNDAMAPTIAPESSSRQFLNYKQGEEAESRVPVNEANVGVLNASQEKLLAERNLTDKECEQIEQVMARYDELTTATIENYQAQTNLYFEQAKTQRHMQENIDADTVLKGAQTELTHSETNLTQQNTLNAQTEGQILGEEYQQQVNITDFVSTTGIPLSADDLNTLKYYEERGEYDKAQNYLNSIFDCAFLRSAGTNEGEKFGPQPVSHTYKVGPLQGSDSGTRYRESPSLQRYGSYRNQR